MSRLFVWLGRCSGDLPSGAIPEGVHVGKNSDFSVGRLKYKNGCSVSIQNDSLIPGQIMFDRENAHIEIGNRVFMNGTLISAGKISIGDDVLISWGVTIVDHNSHSIVFAKRADDVVAWSKGKKDWTNVEIAPVIIESKAWIGFNAIVLKGVTIGEGSIIGAGSVVTKSIPSWSIAAGNPARVIREIPLNER